MKEIAVLLAAMGLTHRDVVPARVVEPVGPRLKPIREGTRTCRCGKTISFNKAKCAECAGVKKHG